MKHLRIFLALALTALCTAAAAQRITLRAGGGLASQYASTETVGAFKVGIAYEHEFSGYWSLEPGLYFYAKGWKDPAQTVYLRDWEGNLLYDEAGNRRTGVKSCSSDAYYLTLPVVFNYYMRLQPMHYIVFSAGPYVAYGVGGKMKTRGDTEQEGSNRYYYATRTFEEEGTQRFEAGITAGIGYEFQGRFVVGVEADFGLTKFNTAAGTRNVSGLLTLGYRFRLGD